MSDSVDFYTSNKLTTATYRHLLAQAVGSTGTIPKIVKMAFGTGGETDSEGNPAAPTGDGPLNNVVLTKDLSSITFPSNTSVCFSAAVTGDELTAAINEIALIDSNGNTAAKCRPKTSKGADAESNLVFNWTMEF